MLKPNAPAVIGTITLGAESGAAKPVNPLGPASAPREPSRTEEENLALKEEKGTLEERLEASEDPSELIAGWAREDPVAAAKWAEARGRKLPSDDIESIAVAWARKDRAAAMAWVFGRMETTERYDSLVSIARQAVESLDQKGAESILAEFPEEVADTVRLHTLAGPGVAGKGGESANFVKAMAVKYAGNKAMSDHVARFASDTVRSLVDKEQGVTQAMAWTESLPDGPSRAFAADRLIDRWTRLDPQAASAWVKTLPPGDTREQAAGRLVLMIFREDPTSAFEWAKTLTNDDQRRTRLRVVFDSWLQKEPVQAIKAAHTLPDAELTGLFRIAE